LILLEAARREGGVLVWEVKPRIKHFILAIVIISAVFVSFAYAEQDDFKSASSHYNQYSPNDLNNPYSQYGTQYSPSQLNNPYSQYGTQYSPSQLNNPYSMESQLSPQKINRPSVQKEHDYRTGIISAGTEGKAAPEVKKESPGEAYLLSLYGKSSPKKSISLYFPLFVLSSLALGATIFIIIGVFKK